MGWFNHQPDFLNRKFVTHKVHGNVLFHSKDTQMLVKQPVVLIIIINLIRFPSLHLVSGEGETPTSAWEGSFK